MHSGDLTCATDQGDLLFSVRLTNVALQGPQWHRINYISRRVWGQQKSMLTNTSSRHGAKIGSLSNVHLVIIAEFGI